MTRLYDLTLAVQGPLGPARTNALEKTVEYDPNASVQMWAWWSPDGAIGRAKGLPASEPQIMQPAMDAARRRARRWWSVLLATLGPIASLTVGTVVFSIDNADDVAHPTAFQTAMELVGTVILVGGSAASIIAAVVTWIRKPAPSAPTPPALMAQGTSDPSRYVTPTATPDVQQARKRVVLLTLAMTLPFAAEGALAAVLLTHAGYLGDRLCPAVFDNTAKRLPVACQHWRHHQLITFIWPSAVIIIIVVVLFILLFRTYRYLERAKTNTGSVTTELSARTVDSATH